MRVRKTDYENDIAITAYTLEDCGEEDTLYFNENDQVKLIAWFVENKPELLHKVLG